MENWQQDLIAVFDITKDEFEQFFHNLGTAVETVAEDCCEILDGFTAEIEDTLTKEFEPFLNEIDFLIEALLEPLVDVDVDVDYEIEPVTFIEQEFNLDTDFEFPQVKPNSSHHPACIGCRHYHGRSYGGNLLVCGMHPYGWDDRNCPDWEEN